MNFIKMASNLNSENEGEKRIPNKFYIFSASTSLKNTHMPFKQSQSLFHPETALSAEQSWNLQGSCLMAAPWAERWAAQVLKCQHRRSLLLSQGLLKTFGAGALEKKD